MPLQEFSYKMFDVDLFAIDCVSVNTVMTLISEVGLDIYKFPSAKHFTSWLRLAPNNRISGGKTISSRTPKGKNKLAQALRNAANTIANKKSGVLHTFFKKIAFRKGRGAAITATARKMATIIYKMITTKTEYQEEISPAHKEKIRDKKLKTVRRIMAEYDLSIDLLSVT